MSIHKIPDKRTRSQLCGISCTKKTSTLKKIIEMSTNTCDSSGFLNSRSKQQFTRLFSFWLYRSLQMQIIGILEILMLAIRSAIPPLSPADIPSTSSIISTVFGCFDLQLQQLTLAEISTNHISMHLCEILKNTRPTDPC